MTIPWRTISRDAVLPATLAVLGVVEMAATRPEGWGYGAALEVVACGLLVFRRRNPLYLATLATVVMLAIPWVGPQLDSASVPIPIWALAVFSLARWLPDLRGLFGVAVMAAAVSADYAFVDQRHHNWSDVIFVVSLIAPPYVLGRLTHRLAEQKGLLEQNQELVKREAVRAERDRIARELHDVIAHSISAMVLQTAAAQDLIHADPDKAQDLLASVAATGRGAMSETGRLLHVIRDDADELGLRPAPGLANLRELVEQFRANGLQVALEVKEPLPVLPAGVDVSAYRIVQEALTNALRYGADHTAALRVSCTTTALSIQASNPSNGSGGLGSGLGLMGIAERVSLLGGSLSHGVGGDGRFELDATLPGGHIMTSVVVADDQDLVRSGLEMVLAARGIEVVGSAADGREAVQVVRRTRPDVILMDIRMPVLDGIAATAQITHADVPTRVLVLTTYDLDAYVYGALKAGAAGFLLKATPPDRLVAGIETIAAGEALLAPSLTRRLIEEHVRRPAPVDGVPQTLVTLTTRELQVLTLIAHGLPNDEIATRLVVADTTIKTHVNRILSKLAATNRVQLAVLAYETGLVRPGDSTT